MFAVSVTALLRYVFAVPFAFCAAKVAVSVLIAVGITAGFFTDIAYSVFVLVGITAFFAAFVTKSVPVRISESAVL